MTSRIQFLKTVKFNKIISIKSFEFDQKGENTKKIKRNKAGLNKGDFKGGQNRSLGPALAVNVYCNRTAPGTNSEFCTAPTLVYLKVWITNI
jgi:hypothetical protein